MDPNETLKMARAAASAIHSADFDVGPDAEERMALAATELADAFTALDEWLSKGGFRPEAWVS